MIGFDRMKSGLKRAMWFALGGAVFWTAIVLLFVFGIRNITNRVGKELAIPGEGVEDLMRAEAGSKYGQAAMGSNYLHGWNGFPEDKKKAARWFEKAAEQGHNRSRFELALLYGQKELFTFKDDEDAVELLELAAADDYAKAQALLGELYLEGETVEKDENKGIDLLKAAADDGNSYAEFRYGELLLEGRGKLDQDKREALKWFEKSNKREAKEAAKKLREELGIPAEN